jgi:hypothetical protein
MPIVLAIEPDRRQAAQLTAIVRHQVGAELVLADTTEGALDAIGNRVPDLVLVPALLSPQDDAALAAALRVIAAAAHVRTLTIPVLASGTKPAAARGVLARWRRSRDESPEPDGCDPAVFGEQISTYLREAAEERAQVEQDSIEEQPVVKAPPLAALAAPTVDELPPIELDFVEPVQQWTAEPVVDERTIELEELIDLSEELAGLCDEDDSEVFDGDPVGVYTISLEPAGDAVEAVDLSSAIQEPAGVVPVQLEPTAAESLDVEPSIETVFVEPPESPRADIEEWVPMYLSPGRMWPALEGMPAESPAPRTEQPDWIELVASLRQDLERRGARPSDGARAETRTRVRKQRPQPEKAKPVQDEWGFFDPEQCGFSTLLAKLEEITDEGARG